MMLPLGQYREALFREVTERILPFSIRYVVDREQGGFYGYVANDGTARPQAPKGLVQHSRLLWTYAYAGRLLGDAGYGAIAHHAYRALMDWFHDREEGGFFWTVDYAGRPLETTKFSYGQAFALYGLAEQARAGGEGGCLAEAVALYHLIERHCGDPEMGGYWEACQRDWSPAPDDHVDPTPLPVAKGMNSHLHLLEAYTTLLRAWDDAGLRARLRGLAEIVLERIVDPETHHLVLYFDRGWRPLSGEVSYGHDIEASWLLVEAAEALGEADLLARAREVALQMADTVLAQGLGADGGLFDEGKAGEAAGRERGWWQQAEAMVGFLNAYQISAERRFLDASLASWAFVCDSFVDKQHGDWFHIVDGAGRPLDREKAGFWKTPYHNTRACLEILERTRNLAW